MYHLRQGQRDIGHTKSNQIVIAEGMPDSKPLVLTWNNTSLYAWSFLDLKKDGPTVVELPPGVLGVFNDMYFRYMSDIGAAGPDKGKGLKPNADGSYDVIFAPKQPKGVDQCNWIQTIPKKSWFILFRAYGPLEPWLDQTWRPSELELVN